MSYNVAICDDEICTCKILEEEIEKAFRLLGECAEIDVFYSGEKIIQYLELGNKYDYVFLDIELYKINGVDVGKYIREEQGNVETQIVFVSSKTSYAMELFAMQPLDFIIKPICESDVKNAIKRGMKYLGKANSFFSFNFKKETKRIPLIDILYFKSELRTVVIRTINGEECFYSRLSSVKDSLPDCFVQVHQSYIVNLLRVKTFRINEIVMVSGECVPISRKYKRSLKTEAMLEIL